MAKQPSAKAPFEIAVSTTGLLKRFGDELKQALFVDVSGDVPSDGTVSVHMHPHKASYRLSELSEFCGHKLVFIPEVSFDNTAVVTLSSGDHMANRSVQVKPEKRWKLFILHHTHFDLGYTDTQDKVWELHYGILDDVIDFCHRTSDYPEGSKFKYIIEGASLLYHWKQNRPESKFDEMLELINSGRVEVLAFHSNLLTELCGHEMLIRGLYHAGELRDRYGVPIRSAMINDIPGYTWVIPELLRNMGIEYLNLRGNYYRGKFLWYRPGAVPRPFMWQAPSGKSILTWYTDSYREANSLRTEGNLGGILEYLDQARSLDYYRYDFYPLRMGGDNNTACLEASINIKAWNEMWEWPKLIMVTNSEFFDYASKFGPYPIYRGDIPDWWADGACSSAQEVAAVRLAQEKILTTEKLFASAKLLGGRDDVPVKDIDEAYENLLLYMEHTWGDSDSGPEPYSEKQTEQYALKKRYADEGTRQTEALATRAVSTFSSVVKSSENNVVGVFNPLSWFRMGLATIEVPDDGKNYVAINLRNDVRYLTQRWKSRPNMISLMTGVIPPLGYGLYRLEETGNEEYGNDTFTCGDHQLENQFYRLTIDPSTGSVSSLFDKETGHELVDPAADWKLNQFIYNAERRPLTSRWMKTRVTEFGPLFVRITAEGCADWFPGVVQNYTLYLALKQLDINNVYTKEERTEREALYTAFPFAIRNPRIECEITDAIMRPDIDQLPTSCRDFYSIQHWVRANGDGASVLWSTVQAPLVQFGSITTDRWLEKLDIRNGHIYAYLLNNHWRTNYKPYQSGDFEYDYAITSGRFPFTNTQSVRFGWEKNTPLVVFKVEPGTQEGVNYGSVCRVSAENVVINNFKVAQDGNGYIFRLWEIEGQPTEVKIFLPNRKIKSASITDPVEKDLGSLRVEDDTVTVPIGGYEVKTVRIKCKN